MSEYVPVMVALVAGPIAAVVTARLSKPKVRADATKTLTDISLSLVEPQKRRIEQLETHMKTCENRISDLEAENRALHRWAQHLIGQVVEHGGDPVPFDSTFLTGGDDE
jgi:uncharacterized membrane-anchored protein YhcB (DUF1043 family)